MRLWLMILLLPSLFAQPQECCRITPLTLWRPIADPEPARASGGLVRRLRDGRFDTVAGTGRAGFNGERGAARSINLGEITAFTFDRQERIFIADGFARIRRVDRAGQ